MIYIERQYIYRLGLEQLEERGDNFNFRCPICGDSQKNPYKKRGFFLIDRDKNMYRMYCHNCNHRFHTLRQYMKEFEYDLYRQMMFEILSENNDNKEKDKGIKVKKINLKKLKNKQKKVEGLKELTDEAIMYLRKRKLSDKFINQLKYTDNFIKFIVDNNLFKDKKPRIPKLDKRIVIPFVGRNNEIFAYQGRALGNSSIRYLTAKVDDNTLKVFGLDNININETIYVLEGPFDTDFVENSIAMAGSSTDINKLVNITGNNLVFVYDNERFNLEIIKKMENVINKGFSVVIWPKSIKPKDPNDMVLNNIDVMKAIKENTFKGSSAKVRLKLWSKRYEQKNSYGYRRQHIYQKPY